MVNRVMMLYQLLRPMTEDIVSLAVC